MGIIKVVVLGDTEVGKTSFTSRWTRGTFPDPSLLKTTVGASFDTMKVTTPAGGECVLSIWDFGGQERFIETLKSMIRGAKVGLFFFDVSRMSTLENLYNYWVPTAEKNGPFNFGNGDGGRFILVGNKIDLRPSTLHEVEKEMDDFCKRFGTHSALISAKTGVGMQQLDLKFREVLDAVSGPGN
jgi:small GTP-binding protein